MISKVCVKSKFVLWQPYYYNLLTEKGRRIYVFETLLFSKTYCYCQSQEIINIFRRYTFAKFTWSNSIMLVEGLIRRRVNEFVA